MLRQAIEKLIDKRDLSQEESSAAMREIFHNADPHQISAFLVLMRAKGETLEELIGIVEAMRHLMIPVRCSSPVLDIVGTGGDGAKTVNISTGSSLLAASCGVKIAKHGNRSVSSLCGAADVLEVLGVEVSSSPEEVAASIERVGIGFMFAPRFHPALQTLAPIRKGLKIRTFFNIIGPLLNPASAQYQMIGVFHEELLDLVAQALYRLGTKHALVFHGCGLDELSCVGPARALEVTPKGMTPHIIDPQKLGLPLCSLEDLRGGNAQHNAALLLAAFGGKEGPIANTLALNAGVALFLYGLVSSYEEGIQLALKKLKEGAPLQLLKEWIR